VLFNKLLGRKLRRREEIQSDRRKL
jgi:hypothetical protein